MISGGNTIIREQCWLIFVLPSSVDSATESTVVPTVKHMKVVHENEDVTQCQNTSEMKGFGRANYNDVPLLQPSEAAVKVPNCLCFSDSATASTPPKPPPLTPHWSAFTGLMVNRFHRLYRTFIHDKALQRKI